jgi:hypothetical protein
MLIIRVSQGLRSRFRAMSLEAEEQQAGDNLKYT